MTPSAVSNGSSPASLTHYTNLAGLQGILQNNELWASNVAFLNDREELLHGVKCAKKSLSNILNDRVLKHWKSDITKIVQEIESGRLPNTYATCFCERSDLLSQWRGYGGSEQGVALVFDRKGIDSLKIGKRSFLAPVQYGLVKGKVELKRSLRERLLAIAEEDFAAMAEHEKSKTVYDALSELIPRFKHKGFEGELEWRLVVQHETVRDNVHFRTNKNVIVPFIKLNKNPLPLKYVRVGPGADQDLTIKSIAIFLEACGYNVEIRKSTVPFRN